MQSVGGGGAKSKDRKTKLRLKNEKLNQQRKRQADEAVKQASTPKIEKEMPTDPTVSNGDVHPSRRSIIPTIRDNRRDGYP